MQTETTVETTAIDTNVEYIQTQNEVKEPPVIGTVFRAIVIETVKDFFGSIIGFFLRYIKHFIDGFRYFWSPSLKKAPFDQKDYKENCQHSFELAMIVLFTILFLVKLELIPDTSEALLEIYNNDLGQMGMQLFVFIIFAALYIIMVLFSILTGRLFRLLFKLPVTRRESDILFIYLNNALFSITAVIALWARCSTSYATGDMDYISEAIANLFLALFFVLIAFWAIRLLMLNRINAVKAILFAVITIPVYSFSFGLSGAAVTAFLIGV